MMFKASTENIIRCSIVGDGLVGKTALVKKFVLNTFSESYEATVFDNFAGSIAVSDKKYIVGVFDTAGQREYESLRIFTYDQSDVIIVCYSAVDRDSYVNITDFWIPEIRTCVGKRIPIILVATQSDLCTDTNECVSTQEGELLARKIRATSFLELSVHDSESVRDLFKGVVETALKKKKGKLGFLSKIFRR